MRCYFAAALQYCFRNRVGYCDGLSYFLTEFGGFKLKTALTKINFWDYIKTQWDKCFFCPSCRSVAVFLFGLHHFFQPINEAPIELGILRLEVEATRVIQ